MCMMLGAVPSAKRAAWLPRWAWCNLSAIGGYVNDEETGVFYLRSRYYSSHKCRFISSDSVLVRITLIGTLNGFAYCANTPIYSIDSEGTNPTIPGDKGFASADEAALAASEIMLGICLYTRIELGTVIYRYYEDGICLYGYADISFGEPHGCDPFATYQHNRIKPNDVAAYAHVHPNLPSFSEQDKRLAEAFPCHAYVADCTTLTMQKYLCQKPIPDQRNLGHKESGIDPIPVTPVGFALSTHVMEMLRNRWEGHLGDPACITDRLVDCTQLPWPSTQYEFLVE